MKVGMYPGSFNPWHKGHTDILLKALKVFDKIIVCKMVNPEKAAEAKMVDLQALSLQVAKDIPEELHKRVVFHMTVETLVETSKQSFYTNFIKVYPTAIIRGLRNGMDLEYEMNQQYWNEDLGLEIPWLLFITDRGLAHVSSSAIRNVEKLGLKHNY